MKNLKQSILLNINAMCSLSPGGIELSWLAYLIDEGEKEVKRVAKELVNEGKIQEPFEGLYLKKGMKVLIATN